MPATSHHQKWWSNAHLCSVVQRLPRRGARHEVRIGACAQQHVDDGCVAVLRRNVQRRKAVLLLQVDPRAPPHQHPHHLQQATTRVTGPFSQPSAARWLCNLVVRGCNVAHRWQEADRKRPNSSALRTHLFVSVLGRHVETRDALFVLPVHVGSCFRQQLHHVDVTALRRHLETQETNTAACKYRASHQL